MSSGTSTIRAATPEKEMGTEVDVAKSPSNSSDPKNEAAASPNNDLHHNYEGSDGGEFIITSDPNFGEGVSVLKTDNSTTSEAYETIMGSSIPSYYCENGPNFFCPPYKVELLEYKVREQPSSARTKGIIQILQELGVKVIVIDGAVVHDTAAILQHVMRVVDFVTQENATEPWTGPLGYARCLLYQDRRGRLFNLTLPQHATGPLSRWQEYMTSFSVTQAALALAVLFRSFPCIGDESLATSLQPAYLSLIFGLVLTEEVSLSLLNTNMFVRAVPSLSAHSLVCPIGSDVYRKLIVFTLAVAGATLGKLRAALTLGGISLACVAMLANLGSRAWHFLHWKPLQYQGYGATAIAYACAMITGLVLPYVGHHGIKTGGKAAMESVISSALLVALVFVLSDYNGAQKFLVMGSQNCNQDSVDILVGIWWWMSFGCSMLAIRRVPRADQTHPDCPRERLLIEDHTSPVGYRVPKLPNYEIDPCWASKGALPGICTLELEHSVGILLSIAGGMAMVAFAFTDWEDNLYETIKDKVAGAF